MIRSVLLALLLSTAAFADDEPTASDVAGAPAPGEESGRADTPDESDSAGTWALRGVLFVPRVAVTVVAAPIEGGAWAIERYRLIERAQRVFFNDAGTFGVFPTFQVDGFGLNIGARMVHRDLFGAHEHFDLRTSGGGRYKGRVATELTSGDRFGRTSLEIGGEYEKRPGDPFYGIGNDDMAVETSYRHRLIRGRGAVDVRVVSDLHLRGAGAVTDHTFSTEDGMPVSDSRNAYGELEVRWDSRGRANDFEPISIISTGQLLALWGGRVNALDDGADFYRYGLDAQQFFRVGPGPRVIAIRSHAEAVTGSLEEVPFNELPRLGGKDVLRGYATDRFRDRIAMVGSLDYQWDLTANMSASLFVDWGRVQRSVSDLETSDMRVGYGMQIDLHTARSFLARASVASSIDGGVFFNFGLDPVFEVDGRVERR